MRRIVAWTSITLDGYTSGPEGPEHDRLTVAPVLVGGGLRLFPDGVSARFDTVGVTAPAHGAVGLHLRRP